MAIRVVCPACRQRLRVPEGLAGSELACPRCGAVTRVPLTDRSSKEALSQATAAARASAASAAGPAGGLEQAPRGALIGVVALVLGLAAVLCVPVLGHASSVLSGVGLLLGLWGLLRPAGGPAARRDGRAVLFPLAGTLVCVGALLLALLPFFFRPW
jgi:hypothetical protein